MDVKLWQLFAAYLLLSSFVAFLLYGYDKRLAIKGRRRIRERTLLSLGFLGGAGGALLGMRLFHHKTKHTYFYFINGASLILQLGLLAMLAL